MNPKSEGMIINRDESQPYVMGMGVKTCCELQIKSGIIIVRILKTTPYSGIKTLDALSD